MKITKMNVEELLHPEVNVRIHTKTQIEELYKSVQMFGQIRPVVVDENNIILAGNGLTRALRENGVKQVDVFQIKGLSKDEKSKLMLADNKIGLLGYDDNDGIMQVLQDLGDFEIPGYDADVLEQLFMDDTDVDEEIESFGIISDEELEEMAETREKLEEKIETARVSPPKVEVSIPIEKKKVENEIKNMIHCPHCGKEIEL